jgi:hypothetical protein
MFNIQDPCIAVWLSRNNQQDAACNIIYYSTVHWQLNMFWAAYRSSSGALTVFAASGLYTHVVPGRNQVSTQTWLRPGMENAGNRSLSILHFYIRNIQSRMICTCLTGKIKIKFKLPFEVRNSLYTEDFRDMHIKVYFDTKYFHLYGSMRICDNFIFLNG